MSSISDIVSDIQEHLDTFDRLTGGLCRAGDPLPTGGSPEVVEALRIYEHICEQLDAVLCDGEHYTGPGGMNGEWQYIGKDDDPDGEGAFYNFALLEDDVDRWEAHKVSVDWFELAGCIDELKLLWATTVQSVTLTACACSCAAPTPVVE